MSQQHFECDYKRTRTHSWPRKIKLVQLEIHFTVSISSIFFRGVFLSVAVTIFVDQVLTVSLISSSLGITKASQISRKVAKQKLECSTRRSR